MAPVFVDAFEQPGKLLYRFDAVIANQGGTLDLFRAPGGGVQQAVYPSGRPAADPVPDVTPTGDDVVDRSGFGAGFEYAYETTHEHFHISSAARYELQPLGGTARVSDKVGFCMFDSDAPAPDAYFRYEVQGENGETWCAFNDPDQETVRMGLSPGGADRYSAQREMQWVDISGLAPGPAVVRGQANPLHCVLESDEANNTTSAAREIPGVRVADVAGGPGVLTLSGTVVAPDVPARRSGDCVPGRTSKACYVWASAAGPLTFRVLREPARGLTSAPATVRVSVPAVLRPVAVPARVARLSRVRVVRRRGRHRVHLRMSAPARLSGRLERRRGGRRVGARRLKARRVGAGPARMALGRLAPGAYRVRLYVNGRLAATARFRVRF